MAYSMDKVIVCIIYSLSFREIRNNVSLKLYDINT